MQLLRVDGDMYHVQFPCKRQQWIQKDSYAYNVGQWSCGCGRIHKFTLKSTILLDKFECECCES